jgi:hypothetical protein
MNIQRKYTKLPAKSRHQIIAPNQGFKLLTKSRHLIRSRQIKALTSSPNQGFSAAFSSQSTQDRLPKSRATLNVKTKRLDFTKKFNLNSNIQ